MNLSISWDAEDKVWRVIDCNNYFARLYSNISYTACLCYVGSRSLGESHEKAEENANASGY